MMKQAGELTKQRLETQLVKVITRLQINRKLIESYECSLGYQMQVAAKSVFITVTEPIVITGSKLMY